MTIDVTNVDEPGVVSLSAATPSEGMTLTATLNEPDEPVSVTELDLVTGQL